MKMILFIKQFTYEIVKYCITFRFFVTYVNIFINFITYLKFLKTISLTLYFNLYFIYIYYINKCYIFIQIILIIQVIRKTWKFEIFWNHFKMIKGKENL